VEILSLPDSELVSEMMNEPSTPQEILELHKIQRSDPKRYFEIVNGWIERDPASSHAYFDRHQAWMDLGEPRNALDDISKAIELEPKQRRFWARGDVYRHLGEYEKAVEDFARGEALDPAQWEEDAFPLLSQADAYARLGEAARALACCARLPEDFWTPGMNELPPGGKSEIADELRRRAASATARKASGPPP
jgi:tetratricopeptide (TPR) repeat protein